jgi:hypothetical protein
MARAEVLEVRKVRLAGVLETTHGGGEYRTAVVALAGSLRVGVRVAPCGGR